MVRLRICYIEDRRKESMTFINEEVMETFL